MKPDLERAKALKPELLGEMVKYLKLIQDPEIKNFTYQALQIAPDYFWVIPSSSSGKYHPAWACEESGLVRHTVLAMYLAYELASTYGLTDKERDIAVSAVALHDTIKYGTDYDDSGVYFDVHSMLPRAYYARVGKEKGIDWEAVVPKSIRNAIFDCVERHMGCINKGSWNPAGLVPTNRVEQVVHLADYISSRKKIHFEDFI